MYDDLPVDRVNQEVVGYRLWRWHPKHERLCSRKRFIWEPGAPSEALGLTAVSKEGLYAWKNPMQSLADVTYWDGWAFGVASLGKRTGAYYSYSAGCVIWGEVSLWGTVYDHERGYRGQFGYPRTLFTSSPVIVQDLRRIYGVEARVMRLGEVMNLYATKKFPV